MSGIKVDFQLISTAHSSSSATGESMNYGFGLFLALAGCGSIEARSVDADSGVDASSTTGDANSSAVDATTIIADASVGTQRPCDPDASFETPIPMGDINTSAAETHFWMAPDELSGLVVRNTGGVERLYVLSRASRVGRFETGGPLALGDITNTNTGRGALSLDGLSLFFETDRTGEFDVMVATRASLAASFGTPEPVGGVSMMGVQEGMGAIADSGRLYFHSFMQGDVSRIRERRNSGVGFTLTDTNVDGNYATITSEGLSLYFTQRVANLGLEIFMARRPDFETSFGTPVRIVELSSPTDDIPAFVSRDGCRLYFSSLREGGTGSADIWVAHRPD